MGAAVVADEEALVVVGTGGPVHVRGGLHALVYRQVADVGLVQLQSQLLGQGQRVELARGASRSATAMALKMFIARAPLSPPRILWGAVDLGHREEFIDASRHSLRRPFAPGRQPLAEHRRVRADLRR